MARRARASQRGRRNPNSDAAHTEQKRSGFATRSTAGPFKFNAGLEAASRLKDAVPWTFRRLWCFSSSFPWSVAILNGRRMA